MQRQRSAGLDSVASSGAPPPGYTSQRDTPSFVDINNDDNDEETASNHLFPPPPPPLMDSPYRDPVYHLPSPYSTEDLRLLPAESHVQNQNPRRASLHRSPTQTCTHGYTHTHSQCTPISTSPSFTVASRSSPNVNRSSFPQQASVRSHSYHPPQQHAGSILNFDSPPHIHSTDDVFGAGRREEHGDNNQTTPPYADYSSLSRQNTRPPALRILTYPDNDNEEEQGPDRSPLNNPNMNSSATLEEPSSYQSHNPTLPRPRPRRGRRPSETPGPITSVVDATTTKFNSKRRHSTSQSQPTNYVHLSRKCNPSMPVPKSWGWRRKTVQVQPSTQILPPPRLSSSSSTITGTFIINPELYIPPSLLNAMEDPLFRFFKPSSNPGDSRRTNLRLEIENGGIDVDIHLVPTTIPSSSKTTNSAGGQLDCDTPVQTQVSASTSTTAFSHGHGHGGGGATTADSTVCEKRPPLPFPRLSQESPATARTCPAVGKTLSRRDKKKKQSQPTTIDLRIKQTQQDSIKINSRIVFPLIARIHAPNPRPPFHLFASTIDIIAKSPSKELSAPTGTTTHEKENQPRASTSNTSTLNEPKLVPPPPPPPPPRHPRRSLSKSRPQKRGVSLSRGGGGGGGNTPINPSHTPSPSLPTTTQLNFAASSAAAAAAYSSSSSPLYLHLPRTFRGPLTIHISSGHISDHLRLSEGLEREVALIRESEFGRGYFVGGLRLDRGRRRVRRRGREEVMMGDGGNVNVHVRTRGGGGVNTITNNHNRQLVNKTKTKNHHEDSESYTSSSSSSSSSSSLILSSTSTSTSTTATTPSLSSKEWYGDRIEILVGCGDVYLQFEDEDEEADDPFCTRNLRKEVGFWKRFTKKVFFL